MRLAHLADLHLGCRRHLQRETGTGLNQREQDGATVLARTVDAVVAARPDLILVAGDIFDKVRVSNLVLTFAVAQFQRLRAVAPVAVIAGNHEAPADARDGCALALLRFVGVDVVIDRAIWLTYPGCRVYAVPEAVLDGPAPPALVAPPAEHPAVLLAHGEVPNLQRGARKPAGIDPATLQGWAYVALGHYHVQHEVAPRVWYSGALDAVSSDPWGELRDIERRGGPGYGWLLVDLETGAVERQASVRPRRHLDLPVIDATGLTAAEVDARLAAALPADYAGQILRQRVINCPTEINRARDHAWERAVKATALHYQLECQRPDPTVTVCGETLPSRGKGIEALLGDYLAARDLPPDMDRGAFVAAGEAALAGLAATP